LDFKEKLWSSQTISTGETAFFDFTEEKLHRIGSDGFEGCVGIVLATNQGAIVGHYTQTPQGVEDAAERITALYNEHRDKVAGATPLIYAMVKIDDETLQEPEIVQSHIDMLKELTGNEPGIHDYINAADTMVDENGNLIEDLDLDNLQYGAFLVENEGGGNSPTNVIFVDINLIKESVQPPA
jgi:hypothetical protein